MFGNRQRVSQQFKPRTLAVFLLSFFALQYAWAECRDTALERWVIENATVRTSVTLIQALTPQTAARAEGASIKSPGGGLNIRNGCDGTEILFLLVAALIAHPLRWRTRLIGLALGTVFVFVANQLRLLALFYSLRHDQLMFDRLHSFIAPLALIVAVLLFFMALLEWDQRRRTPARV